MGVIVFHTKRVSIVLVSLSASMGVLSAVPLLFVDLVLNIPQVPYLVLRVHILSER